MCCGGARFVAHVLTKRTRQASGDPLGAAWGGGLDWKSRRSSARERPDVRSEGRSREFALNRALEARMFDLCCPWPRAMPATAQRVRVEREKTPGE